MELWEAGADNGGGLRTLGGEMEWWVEIGPEGNNEVRIRNRVRGAEIEAVVSGMYSSLGGIWRPAQMESSLPFSHPSLVHTGAPNVL